ncbi:Synaptosomal-associated protein 29 [Strongyloides ratti]|uniref:Synaptosomal-associated protein 29 n=1 Tax=Strongyloides ratti TaxID=34506 RepID=A0A090LFL3_STRRB|nr:Synaptosomal-associated protein 29 [Strongyloides ratti]CEF68581.1 Synaptosomal-associated protein 29 [Strongyloides ratti]
MANPFDDDDDDLPKSYSKVGKKTGGNDIDYYEREIEKYMQESLDSTQRSRAHLENSETLAIKTAQDLLEQREKLERTEQNLDKIQHTTSMTQRNLNSLKSVFGGFFKNKFSKKPAEPTPTVTPSTTSDKLSSYVSNDIKSTSFNSNTGPSQPTLSQSSRDAIKDTRWEEMNNEIEANFDYMSESLSRLKQLGTALNDEVDDQNKLLDRIQVKADRNDSVVRSQDAQMKKLLGYKNVTKPEDTAAFAGRKK